MKEYDERISVCFGTTNHEEQVTCFESIAKESKTDQLVVMNRRMKDALQLEDYLKQLDESKSIFIQAIYLNEGREYHKLMDLIATYPNHHFEVTKPLLQKHASQVAAFLEATYPYKEGRKVILMGHGSKSGNQDYERLMACFKRTDFELKYLKELETFEEDHCLFVPLMFCAGHHVDEIYAILKTKNCDYTFIHEGLGSFEAFRKLFLEDL